VSDTHYNSVTLLLHGDGSDGSTTFTDNSSLAQTVTVVGSAQVDTAQSKWGGASIYIPGSGSRLTAPSGSPFAFGTADFCIEMWVRPYADATSQGFQCIASSTTWTSGANSGDWALYNRYDGASSVVLIYKSGSSFLDVSTGVNINDTAWHHVAVTRSGSDLRVFVDGTLGGTATYSGDFGRSDKTFMVGAQTGDSRWFDGHIDDVRVTKGVARYTATFTAPTAAFPDTPPPPEIIIEAAGPLGVPAFLAHHQFTSIEAAGPLGAPAIVASQYYASVEAAGPLGTPALVAHHQFSSVEAAGPLGAAQILGAQQLVTIAALGPLGTAQILATFPVVASIAAAGPLGSPAALLWHDFTTSLTGLETSRYVMDLITPGGVVRVPISSWQATLQTDASCFVQCVVPAASDYTAHILAATEFVITRQATLPGGQVISYEMARSPLEQIAPSQGPTNYTIVLSGYPDALTANEDPPTAQDRTLNGVRSVAGLSGTMRVRCNIDWLLRPGMRAYQDTAPVLVDYINYYVNTQDQYMDVGERA
jgi:hypothetical protein